MTVHINPANVGLDHGRLVLVDDQGAQIFLDLPKLSWDLLTDILDKLADAVQRVQDLMTDPCHTLECEVRALLDHEESTEAHLAALGAAADRVQQRQKLLMDLRPPKFATPAAEQAFRDARQGLGPLHSDVMRRIHQVRRLVEAAEKFDRELERRMSPEAPRPLSAEEAFQWH